MKRLHHPVLTLAIAGGLLVAVPAFASHPPVTTQYGTPLHNGIPAFRQPGVDRIIVVDTDARHINVAGGQRVRFVIGEASFEWLFDTYDNSLVFELNQIAPPGLLDARLIRVYVAPDPLYTS